MYTRNTQQIEITVSTHGQGVTTINTLQEKSWTQLQFDQTLNVGVIGSEPFELQIYIANTDELYLAGNSILEIKLQR